MAVARIAIIALALAAIVTLVIVLLRRRSASSAEPQPLVLVAGRLIAALYACVTLVATLVAVISTLVADQVTASIPVNQFWPTPYPWIEAMDGPTAEVTDGGFELAEVTVAGLGMDARLFLAAGHAAQGAAFIVIAVTIALLCQRLLSGAGFTSALTRAVSVTGVTIAIAGIAWQVLFSIGGTLASEQVLRVTGWVSEDPPGPDTPDPRWDGTAYDQLSTGLPDPGFSLAIDFWPLLLGLALAAVGLAFKRAERLQRDTEGLV